MTARRPLAIVGGQVREIATGDTVDSAVLPSGSTTINYAQPLAVDTFTPAAGANATFTLANTSYGVVMVLLNGQGLQPSEWSATSTQVTVTPAEGAFLTSDRVTIIYAKATVFAGATSGDTEITGAGQGLILNDRSNGHRYRLFMNNGVLSSELVS